MILVADSGATKTDWRLIISPNRVLIFSTLGLNPYHVPEAFYQSELSQNFPTEISPSQVSTVFFYGAGCALAEKARVAETGLQKFFPNAHIQVLSDILAAARALFGKQQGIAAILGTGTNVGCFDGEQVTHFSPSLGFILGDEGSGAFLGKEFMRMWLYGELPREIASNYERRHGFSLSHVLHSVYAEPMAARFLAGAVPFIFENRHHPFISEFLSQAFKLFAQRHIAKIPNYTMLDIGIVGSIGALFEHELGLAIASIGGRLAQVLQFPIERLVAYHSLER